jgi:hypothetical protein
VGFVRSLVRAEYVVVFKSNSTRPGEGAALVCPYPDESVVYGDLYELAASGFSTGGSLRIFKSTAEPFSASERRSAEAGMRRNFYEGADEDGVSAEAWNFELQALRDARSIDVLVGENESDDD